MNTIKAPLRNASRISAQRARELTSFVRWNSEKASDQPSKDDKNLAAKATEAAEKPKSSHKTVAEADAELMEKLAGHADEGGAAGVEYENGKPVAQKRSVKNNMFRLI